VFGTKENPATTLRYAVEAGCIVLVLGLAWLATRKKSRNQEPAQIAAAAQEPSREH